MPTEAYGAETDVAFWPIEMFLQTGWDARWAKRDRKTRLRQLAIAGALIAAEIDRLLRNEEE
jgi:hypothetical protein